MHFLDVFSAPLDHDGGGMIYHLRDWTENHDMKWVLAKFDQVCMQTPRKGTLQALDRYLEPCMVNPNRTVQR